MQPKSKTLGPDWWIEFSSKIRSWNFEFFQINKFSLPSESEILKRISYNLNYYEANYLLLTALILALGLLFDIFLLILLVVSYFLWNYILKNKPIQIYNDNHIIHELKIIILIIINVLIILLFSGTYIFTLIGFCCFFVIIHGILQENLNYRRKDDENPVAETIHDTQIINKDGLDINIIEHLNNENNPLL